MQWIDINDKLPEHGQKILVLMDTPKGKDWAQAEFFCQKGYEPRFDEPYYGQQSCESFENVTHWGIPETE